MAEYEFEVRHGPVVQNATADYLSRAGVTNLDSTGDVKAQREESEKHLTGEIVTVIDVTEYG